MRTFDCATADNPAVALSPDTRVALHARCPGAYRLSTTDQVCACDCTCHPDVTTSTMSDLLPVLEPPAAEGTGSGTKGPREARERPRRARGVGTGRCEHCGAPTGGRFAPGHDAKHKRDLVELALGDDVEAAVGAWAEMHLREWDGLIPGPKLPSINVVLEAEQLAEREGYELVVERSRERIERHG